MWGETGGLDFEKTVLKRKYQLTMTLPPSFSYLSDEVNIVLSDGASETVYTVIIYPTEDETTVPSQKDFRLPQQSILSSNVHADSVEGYSIGITEREFEEDMEK